MEQLHPTGLRHYGDYCPLLTVMIHNLITQTTFGLLKSLVEVRNVTSP